MQGSEKLPYWWLASALLLLSSSWANATPLQRPAAEPAPLGQPESQAERTGLTANEPNAEELLQEARSHYERGEFAAAEEDFAAILDSPVQLRTRQDLHEGFLYYAFTLLLRGDPHASLAAEKLRYALRLDPDYLPSPVTTRPDILDFYNRQRDAYIAANGPVSEPPGIVFPELQDSVSSTRVLRRRWFVPAFGIGLRFLGHPKAANLLMSTEIAALSINLASIIMRAALIEDLSPAGYSATEFGRYGTYISFAVFWAALITDIVVSLSLRRSYERNPERRPSKRGEPAERVTKGPQIRPGPTGLVIQFW
ncbi:MAG: hypothetical protein CMP23_08275 [Rickettsiales bacterium]|nr:hypothetical protein [Rickettsiales bacterium]